MPLWEEYKEIARERGSLAFELFVVESTPAAAPDALKETLPRHLAYLKEMEKTGRLFLAGPLSDDTGEQMIGAGLLMYRAQTMDEARELARNDPMHAEGIRTFTLRKWLINEGSPSFEMRLGDNRVELK